MDISTKSDRRLHISFQRETKMNFSQAAVLVILAAYFLEIVSH